jgi:hypothetical protein
MNSSPAAGAPSSWIALGVPAGTGAIIAGAMSLTASNGAWLRGPILLVLGILVLTACVLVRHGPGEAFRAMRAGWDRPSGSFVFGLGWAMALPVFALHTDVVMADSDSARIVAALVHVREHGVDYLVNTQEVFIPHIVLGALMRLGGIPLMKLFSVVELQFLSGVVAFLAWRVSGRVIGAVGAVLALLSVGSILERAYLLPMYPLMLGAGCLSAYLVYLAACATTKRDRLLRAAGAAALLWVSIESHEVGQIFLVVPLLMLLSRQVWKRPGSVLATFAFFVLMYVPRLIVNLSEGGFKNLLTSRVDFWITKGYLLDIQLDFWYLPRTVGLADYLELAPSGVVNILGWIGLPMLGLTLGSLFLLPKRLRWFAGIFFVLLASIAIGRRLPFYPRYFSPLVVGAATASGIAIARLVSSNRGLRVVGVCAMTIAAACAVAALSLRTYEAATLERQVLDGPYATVAERLPEGAHVIGARATYVHFTRTDVESYGEQFLTEEELATFLAWRPEHKVLTIMRDRGIDWVLVPKRPYRWVNRYHRVWMAPAHGMLPRYHRRVRRSDALCEILTTENKASLYRIRQADDPLDC